MRLKKKKIKNKFKNIFWLMIFVILFTILFLMLITSRFNPILLRYSQIETRRFATIFIRHAVGEVIDEELEDLYTINSNTSGEVQSIEFNAVRVSRLLQEVNENVQKTLLKAETGDISGMNLSSVFRGERYEMIKNGIVCELNFGIIIGSGLFSNLGPKIPVRWAFIGQVITKLETNITEYGINNVYLELNLHVEITQRILLPVRTEEELVQVNIPIGIKMIQGSIPDYYGGIMNHSSLPISLPIR